MMLAKVTGVSCQSHSKGSDFIICVGLGSPVVTGRNLNSEISLESPRAE
jgi:hypothetical protein